MKRIWVLLLLLGVLAGGAAGRDYNPRMHKAEWRYVDEADDAKASELLEKLLRTHGSERKAKRLLTKLAKGRPYAPGLDRSKTISLSCTDGLDREFTYYLPSRYSPKRPTGVLVFLHGAISQPPPGGGVHEAKMLGAAVDDLNMIKIGPSTYSKHEWGEPAVRDLVRRALDQVKQRFNVDENRVFLAGDSDGGRGTYALIETDATFYAAAVPVIGAPGGVTRFVNLRNLPWLAINGAKDGLFKIDQVKQLVTDMKDLGFDLDFREIADAGHDPRLFLKRKDDVCEFVKKHPRDPLPKVVDWQVDPAAELAFPANTFRWIRIEETGATSSNTAFEETGRIYRRNFPRVRAEKGEGNAVEVKTSGVKRFSILVSDRMFDLDEPIRVTVNGKLLFREVVTVDARVLLEEMRRYNDRQLVFANRITLEVDAPPVPDED